MGICYFFLRVVPYFTLVAGNHHLTNKPEADGVLILPPSLRQCAILWYLKLLKATGKGKKSKEGVGVTPAK